MTYAGLKSLIYAGLAADDPRVKAAVKWIKDHYTLGENPGMGSAGLYYYYQAYARALAALGVDEFTDSTGKKHDWRAELVRELASRQQADGSWLNENARWLEGNPNLVTGYVLLTLSYARK
jgi:squalene-hopene/tetraprenyl-beta-curcumene cyclase